MQFFLQASRYGGLCYEGELNSIDSQAHHMSLRPTLNERAGFIYSVGLEFYLESKVYGSAEKSQPSHFLSLLESMKLVGLG